MLLGLVYLKNQSLILRDQVDGSEQSMPLQDALNLLKWLQDHKPEIEARIAEPDEQEQKENALLVTLCREAGDEGTDEQLSKGARANHLPDDIRDAANGDVAALVRLRQAFGLSLFS